MTRGHSGIVTSLDHSVLTPPSMMAEDALLEALEALSPTTKRFLYQLLGLLDWSAASDAPVASTIAKPAARTRNLDAEKVARANARRSRHRDRERRELMYLRACSHALENELQRLQQRGEERQEAPNPTGAWRALALIRRKERKKSEQENEKLRALWRSQLQFLAQMQQVSQIQRNICPPGGFEARIMFSDADVEAIDVLTEDLEALFKQSNHILSDSGVSSLPEENFCRSQEYCGTEDSTPGVEMHSVLVLQSKYEDMREGAMNKILGQFFANGAVQLGMERSAGHTTVSFKSRHRYPSSSKVCDDPQLIDILMALRHYNITPDRHIVVWKSVTSGSSAMKGTTAIEFGVCVFHRALTNSSHSMKRRMRRIQPMSSASSTATHDESISGMRLSKMTLAATEAVVSEALSAVTSGDS